MSERPITDRHVAFARALIALAREHGASNLSVEFSLTGAKLWPPSAETGWSDARVKFDWSEGRHGCKSRALLRAESSISVQELGDIPEAS